MASPLGSHGTVTVDDGTGSSISIQVTEPSGLKSEGLSYSTWGAAFVLSSVLHTIRVPSHHEQGRLFDVLEIGAGTGLVGIAAAAVWKRNTILTDLPSLLPGLKANIDVNFALLQKRGTNMSCGSLDWNSPEWIDSFETHAKVRYEAPNKPSVILAADTFYDPDHAPLVANTIKTWLRIGSRSRAILCYPLRIAYIDYIRDFWDHMATNGLECVQEGRQIGKDEWNEVPGTEFEWCVWKWKEESEQRY